MGYTSFCEAYFRIGRQIRNHIHQKDEGGKKMFQFGGLVIGLLAGIGLSSFIWYPIFKNN